MPDTHDERGGDEAAMLLAIRRRALTAATYAEWHQVGRDIETLGQKLANATARADRAEAERDAWKSEAERRSSERNAAVRRIGLVRECLNASGELLPGLAELLENGTGRALSATETDAKGGGQ